MPYVEPTIGEKRTTPCPQQGWALRNPKKAARFSSKQKEYLDRRFQIGEVTGKKSDPLTVSKDMRCARDAQGWRLFRVQEFLTSQQLSSYFSRLASKRRKTPADEEEDQQDPAVIESTHSRIQQEIIDEVQLRHPIVYDTYNLCDLAKGGDLYELGISLLRAVCEHFDVQNVHGDITTITDRRRKSAYVAKLQDYLSSCPCAG